VSLDGVVVCCCLLVFIGVFIGVFFGGVGVFIVVVIIQLF